MTMAMPNLPLSVIIKSKDNEEPKKKSREDWRKAKELEEARKAGTAPAAVDEEGKDINPHIPQYIASSPWYFGSSGPTLKHQRPQEEKQKQYSTIEEWYKRGVRTFTSTKFRKGACENCGALTHKKKDCMERPRRVGARYTGEAIAPDEFLQPELSHDYDGKRDRWNGYDSEGHKAIIEEYAKIEEAKRLLKAEKLQEDLAIGEANKNQLSKVDNDNDVDDEDKYADDIDMPGTKVDSKQRITVRNLRIREDTAKYLRNLDPNSAYYDPKTRSMRDNPYKSSGKNPEVVQFAGDNFVRYSGDTTDMAKAQMFSWEAYDRGVDVHLQAEPTKLELLQKQFEVKKEEFKHQLKGSILERYGGEEHLDVPPKQLLLAQTEDYMEYSRHGRVIKGQEKAAIRSKYEEDVYTNNHLSVWGSYWKDGNWGFKCCYSFSKLSYCTGDAGKEAEDGIITAIIPHPIKSASECEEDESEKTELELYHENIPVVERSKKKKSKKSKKKKRKLAYKKKKKDVSSGNDSSSEDDNEEIIKKEKLRQALEAEEDRIREVDRLMTMDERKRPYNSMYDVKEPTEEEMEAYRMKRLREDDPMAQFLGR